MTYDKKPCCEPHSDSDSLTILYCVLLHTGTENTKDVFCLRHLLSLITFSVNCKLTTLLKLLFCCGDIHSIGTLSMKPNYRAGNTVRVNVLSALVNRTKYYEYYSVSAFIIII